MAQKGGQGETENLPAQSCSENDGSPSTRMSATGLTDPPGDFGRKGRAAGTAVFTMVAQNGREITLDYADPGAVLGEIAVLNGGGRSASVIALSAGSYLRLTRAAFEAFVERQPGVAWRLLKELARRLRQTNDTVESDRAFASGPRLARFLQRLTLSGNPDGRLRLDLSQTELGSFAGMSRENINRQLSAWADAGVIALEHGQIRVLDSNFLSEIAASSE